MFKVLYLAIAYTDRPYRGGPCCFAEPTYATDPWNVF